MGIRSLFRNFTYSLAQSEKKVHDTSPFSVKASKYFRFHSFLLTFSTTFAIISRYVFKMPLEVRYETQYDPGSGAERVSAREL